MALTINAPSLTAGKQGAQKLCPMCHVARRRQGTPSTSPTALSHGRTSNRTDNKIKGSERAENEEGRREHGPNTNSLRGHEQTGQRRPFSTSRASNGYIWCAWGPQTPFARFDAQSTPRPNTLNTLTSLTHTEINANPQRRSVRPLQVLKLYRMPYNAQEKKQGECAECLGLGFLRETMSYSKV